MNNKFGYIRAIDDFRRERNRAALQTILGRVTGKSVDLLSFDDISRKLHISGGFDRGLKDIPIDAIVGSVSRYSDFTRSFLPRHDSDMTRWARVKEAVSDGMMGLPPIEVYKVGEAYFVKDGHHRVSVARRLGAKQIQAYVNEIQTKVPITPDVQPEELILKAEYVDFLEKTRFDELVPNEELRLTVPGTYRLLEEHLRVHQYFMGIDLKRDVPFPEAVVHWYQEVYLPVKKAILEQGVLREFPGRTETDLYMWISEHRYLLEKDMGWRIRPEVAAADLTRQQSPRWTRVFQRTYQRVKSWLLPDMFEDAPATGEWRKERTNLDECLFRDILVPLSGEEESWAALEQALVLTRCQGTRLNGLHVMPENPDPEKTEAIRQRYEDRCQAAGVEGSLAFVQGEVSHAICEWALLGDLVVLNLAYPPAPQMLARIGSGFRTIIRRCARPILAVPGAVSPADRLLLAYDGSPKAREALFLSAYLAGRWSNPLVVMTVDDGSSNASRVIQSAEQYLKERDVHARFVRKTGPVAKAILDTCSEEDSNLILMGGYGFNPVVEVMLGSAVDAVLRETQVPVLICH
ncbi:MAG TPA: universal stress protein [Anaerolineaceae bacterium]|nr:universal stress protein [Anaerolineaceae bacterium]